MALFRCVATMGIMLALENGAEPMTCDRPTIGGWEKFNFATVSTGGARIATTPQTANCTRCRSKAPYPNPFTTNLFYTLPEKYSSHTVRVFDLSGRVMLNYTVKGSQGTYKLDGSKLPNGLYIVDISSGEYHQRVKVQKAK